MNTNRNIKTYLVGGAVRDELMGKLAKDRDYVVVGANPEDLLSLGYEQVGADFPVFLHPVTGEEYALARSERKNGVGYHGFDVITGPGISIEEDLIRRDLTINAIAKDENGTLIDPYGGVEDINNKILRHVSSAFAEDPLRVVRLARFAARYMDFSIAPETVTLAKSVVTSGELNHLHDNRFYAEIVKAFSDGNQGIFFDKLKVFGVFEHVNFFKNFFRKDLDVNDICTFAYMSKKCKNPVDCFLASTADAKYVETFNSHASKMAGILRWCYQQQQANAQTYLTFMKLTRGWNGGVLFCDMVDTLKFTSTPLSWTVIEIVSAIDIKSTEFPHLQGAEVGKAIDAARLNIMNAFLT